MIKVLSIAGSDPSGGAGIQADLKVFQSLGAFGMAVPAALTVQNSRGVSATYPVYPITALAMQLKAVFSDMRPDAIKTGMLLTRRNIYAVAQAVRKYRIRNLVVDPVIMSSSGMRLMSGGTVITLKKYIFPTALVVTPNLEEAEALTGRKIMTRQDMDYAAGDILDMGPSYVLIKGGHLKGPAEDTLYGGRTVLSFSSRRRKGEFHGTGCALSSAIAVFIARGYPVEKAVEKAKMFVDKLLKTAKPAGRGKMKYFRF